jgi:hypothetical protein
MKATEMKRSGKTPPKGYKAGGKVGAMKPCSGCPSPAKCKAAGKCMKAGK